MRGAGGAWLRPGSLSWAGAGPGLGGAGINVDFRALLAVAVCACSAPPDATGAGPEQDTTTTLDFRVRTSLCFRVDPALTDWSAVFVPSLEATAASWGWELDQDRADCHSTIELGDLTAEADGHGALGMTLRETDTGCLLGEPYVGHYSRIIIDGGAIERFRVVDTSPEGCAAGDPPCTPLGQVLRHELGHVLEVPHTGSKVSPMHPVAQPGRDYLPRPTDIERALKPGRHRRFELGPDGTCRR